MLVNGLLYVLVGIGAAMGVRALLNDPAASPGRRQLTTLIAVLGGALAAGIVAFALHDRGAAKPPSDGFDKTIAQLAATPLFGRVMQDNPALETELKTAVESGQDGRRVIAQWRARYVAPALQAADDGSILAAWNAHVALVGYLEKTNPSLCAEFGLTGIKDAGSLDGEARRLFAGSLEALEQAYVSGRGKPKARVDTDQEADQALDALGFGDADRTALNARTDDKAVCDGAAKLYGPLDRLQAEKRAPYARYILSM
ncbi:hypothetical protein [Chelatococcus reniformis]|uniref:Uncharacterized protein n=1 Tax=Chelatococcus reniformis TaxID=1494448 RepID=A0A916TY12_9HYPH|nr:hypothetical protein [Chelatococcus reniformis]GGC48979.1 hypothetical protein GCM10010994_05210 [Chelatococcus reniformis]